MDIVIIDIIVLLAVCFGVAFSKVLFRSYWAPFGVLSLLWGASLLWLSVMTFQIAPFHTLTWLAILLAWCSAMLGSFFAVVVFHVGSNSGRRQSYSYLIKYKKWIIILGILSLIGSIRFFLVVVNYFGIAGFFANPLYARTMLTTEYSTGKLTLIFEGVTFAAAVLSGIWIGRQSKGLLLYLPLLSASIFSICYVGRGHVVTAIIFFVSAFLLANDRGKVGLNLIRLNIKKIYKSIVLFLIPLIFLTIPTMFISQYRSKVPIDSLIPQFILRFFDFFQHWYLLDEVIQHPSPMNMGVNVFPSFIRSLYYIGLRGDDGRALSSGTTSIFMPLGSMSNKYTLVADVYLDFGFWGIFFYFLFFGLLSGFVFCLYKRYNRLIVLALLPFFYHAIFVSFGGSNFDYASVFAALIAVGVSAFIEKRWRVTVRKKHCANLVDVGQGSINRGCE